jgi:hypothetical protein
VILHTKYTGWRQNDSLTPTPRLGATTLQIRRAFEGASALGKAAVLLLFVAQRRPAAATACYYLKKLLDSCATNSGHTSHGRVCHFKCTNFH